MKLVEEAEIISRYLIGEAPTPDEARRYEAAHGVLPLGLSDREQRLLDFALARPALLGCVDGALALVRADSPIRRKLFVMLAILEASPKHTKAFIDEPKSRLGVVLALMFGGMRAAARAALGLALAAAFGALGGRRAGRHPWTACPISLSSAPGAPARWRRRRSSRAAREC